jgi:acyl-CoA thioesterase-1
LALSSSVFAEPVTIVALGDSLTAGYGLADQSQGLVPQLEAWLKARGADVVVQNAGVSGDTTAGGLARVGWALGPEADAMIVTLGGNDMLRGLDPAASKASLDGVLKEAKARGLPVLLVAMKAPGNFGPEYKAAFDGMYAELATQYGSLLAEDFFAGLRAAGADPGDPASLAAYMQPDGIHPNPEGVKLIVEGLGPKVEELLARVAD